METVVRDLAALESLSANTELLRLYTYWADKRNSREFPSRREIDPIEFKFALSRVSLIDVTEDQDDFTTAWFRRH